MIDPDRHPATRHQERDIDVAAADPPRNSGSVSPQGGDDALQGSVPQFATADRVAVGGAVVLPES
jgi:hypothetical protein